MEKFRGFTLIELMIASTIATIVLVVSFALIGNIYFAHKQIRIAQNFYSEARFLLEKIVTISRENTIDYDRYFVEVGPNPDTSTGCPSFDDNQVAFGGGNLSNSETNRTTLGYPNIFYWKVSDDVYRNLGGVKIDGGNDLCAQAFHGDLNELYLINEDRNIRTAIKKEADRIQTSIELGADTDNDGKVDIWGHNITWDSGTHVCKINQPYSNEDTSPPTLTTSIDNEDLCYSAHDFENISAKRLFIDSFNFTPYPDRDPYLNFRNDEAQIHPNVFLYLKISLLGYEDYAFENQPTITMQTSTSSRVFKNTRK